MDERMAEDRSRERRTMDGRATSRSTGGIRVLIVDDHMIIRRGLAQILAGDGRIGAVSEAEDGPAALRALRAAGADVVLLDIALGDRDGLDVLKAMRGEFPATGVVMLSVYPETQFAVRSIRAGAAAYLNKGCSPETLFAAIAKVAGGGVYITPEIAELLARNVRADEARPPHETLSNREFQVLKLLAQGRSVSEIAEQLSLSVNTISTYRSRVFDKLGVRSMVELLTYAARQDLLPM
ncbi:response regulator [Azoarcus indigens]|uniref:LuxR family two component transcriptional regulator n=1 Tax=Azoarcus indigens TaxID=29545 RepID=A0A4R6EFQ7_9RHOO|nr:response regulator transcription factor [Azoarcus indigens]TDN57125.1 LuxR family two component transcriptional regulator [Azoarcus indigens]